MKVIVRFFARAIAGTESVAFDLPGGATVDDLRGRLAFAYPRLASLLDRSALAVHEEFANGSVVLQPGAEVALLPPVSGG